MNGEKNLSIASPVDILAPELGKAREDIKDLGRHEGDVLIYALYLTTGKRFLRWKYGLEPVPESVKPKTMEDIEKENELMAKAKAGKLVESLKSSHRKKVQH